MNAEAEQQRSVAVIDVPFAAISGARDIRSKITGGPGLRAAAVLDVGLALRIRRRQEDAGLRPDEAREESVARSR